jgi:UDP-N-acetylglucosamine transferase subunit ALG13
VIPRQRSGAPAPGTVLVVVGTDVHGFDRLMDWLQRWYAARLAVTAGINGAMVGANGAMVGANGAMVGANGARAGVPGLILQYGHSTPPPLPGAVPFLGHEELQQAMATSTLVVTHGGPATITEARRNGHLPIVVPRDPAHREHVDNHQQLFARRLGAAGMVCLCETENEFADALDKGLANPTAYELAADPQAQDARAEAVAKVGRIVEDLVAQRTRRASRWRR